MDIHEKELYKFLGRLEGKLDSICQQLTGTYKRLDRLEADIARHREELSAVKQIQAKHAVLVTLISTICSAVLVYIITQGGQ